MSLTSEDMCVCVCVCVCVYIYITCVPAEPLQSCLTLCDLMDCSPPGSSDCGILQIRILEWVAMLFSEDLPDPGVKSIYPGASALAGRFFTTSTTWEAHNM